VGPEVGGGGEEMPDKGGIFPIFRGEIEVKRSFFRPKKRAPRQSGGKRGASEVKEEETVIGFSKQSKEGRAMATSGESGKKKKKKVSIYASTKAKRGRTVPNQEGERGPVCPRGRKSIAFSTSAEKRALSKNKGRGILC